MKFSDFEEYQKIATKYGLLDDSRLSSIKTKDFLKTLDTIKTICQSYIDFRSSNPACELARHTEHGTVLVTGHKIIKGEDDNCILGDCEVINRKKQVLWVKKETLIPYNNQSEILFGEKK